MLVLYPAHTGNIWGSAAISSDWGTTSGELQTRTGDGNRKLISDITSNSIKNINIAAAAAASTAATPASVASTLVTPLG